MGKSTAIVLSIFAGLLSASCLLLVLTLSFGGLLLAYLTPLPLFLAGLTLGLPGVVVAGMAGTAMSFAGGSIHAGIFLLGFAVPAGVLVRQALLARPAEEVGGRQGELFWYPPELLVMWLAGLAVALFLVMLVISTGIPGGLPGLFRAQVEAVLSTLPIAPGPNGQGTMDKAVEMSAAAERVSNLVPALVGGSWMIMVAINGALAQGLAKRLGRALRPSPDIAAIDLPPGLASFVVVLGVFTIFIPEPGRFVALTLLVIAGCAFLFQGIGVVHALARKARSPGMMLGSFYALLGIFSGLVVMVAVLGFIERWAHIRRKLGSGPFTKE